MISSNKNAKIGFVIYYPFQYYVYKNVFKHLADHAEFIIDMGAHLPVVQPPELLERIVALLNKNNAPYKILRYEDYSKDAFLKKFYAPYEVLVSVWEKGCMRHRYNEERKKVRMAYGSGKELTMLRPSGGIYDLTLAYGERDSKSFSLYSKTVIVGNPKFDDWFSGNFEKQLLRDIENKIDRSKKTVLYLPTHSDLCSIPELLPELNKISSDYNIIIKLHYFNIVDTPEIVNEFKKGKFILYGDETDLLPLLYVADMVLSDNSSAIFDAMLADKPVLATDFFSKEYLDIEHKEPKIFRRGVNMALTYSGSIEQQVKKDGLILTIKFPEELKNGIERALLDETFFKNARKKICKELFAFQDGQSGERAAKEIEGLRNAKARYEKTPLTQAMDASLKTIRSVRAIDRPAVTYLYIAINDKKTTAWRKIIMRTMLLILKACENILGHKLYIRYISNQSE